MPTRTYLMICFVLLGTACAPLTAAYAQNARTSQGGTESLRDLSEKIQKQKKKLEKVAREEAELISRLNEIEKRLQKESRDYESTARDIKRLQEEIRSARTRVNSTQHESDSQRQLVQARLAALYKYYRRSGLRILLSSASYNELLRTEKALGLIIGRDQNMLDRSIATLERQRRYESQLQARRTRLIEARSQIAEEQKRIKSTRLERTSHLDRIQQEKSLQLKALRELEEHARRLQQFIDKLPSEKKKYTATGVRFSRMRGRLAFPVKGDIVSRFGRQAHPELKTFTYQKGITVKTKAGTPIRAVHDGRVAFADWFKGYGYMIIVDHGEHYYSLSAHASELLKKVDDIVAAGETIAHVGDTSSLKGAGLYFEIRYHGKPQDPLTWLKKGGNR